MIQIENLLSRGDKHKNIYKYLFKYKFWIKVSILLTIFEAIIQIPFPIITKIVIDKIILQKQQQLFLGIVVSILTIIPFMVITSYLKLFYLFKLNQKVTIMLRKSLCDHFLHLHLSIYQKLGPGYLSNRIFNDVEILVRSIFQVLFPILQNIFLFIISLTLMFFISWQLAIIPCLFLPPYIYFNYCLGIKLKNETGKLVEKKAKNADFFTDMFQSVENLRYHTLENSYLGTFFHNEARIVRQNLKLFFCQANLESLNKGMMIATPALALIAGIPMIIKNTISLGEYVAFSTFLTYFLAPVKFFFSSNITFQDFRISLERINKAFSWPISFEYQALRALDSKLQKNFKSYDICFENVSFSYDDQKLVLKNVSFTINQGEKVAIMGKSGSGKTTILKLLMGLYCPTSGDVKIGGQSYKDIDLIKYRKTISFVEQEPVLFKGTVEQNIALCGYSNLIKNEKLEETAKMADAHEFITKMEKGYQTDITRLGNNLSVGQKQRIALSRFFYKDTEMLILDEPTSSIDKESALYIRNTLEKTPENKTIIIVTHDPLIAELAQRVIFICKGEIVEDNDSDTFFENTNHIEMHTIQENFNEK